MKVSESSPNESRGLPSRQSIRLSAYDYSLAGAYFVTICTREKAGLLGEVVAGEVRLSAAGRIVERCWRSVARHFAGVALDAYVIMPNHIHGVVWICEDGYKGRDGASAVKVAPARRVGTTPGSLAAIVQNFKSTSTRRVNASRRTPGATIWQRNYYEHIIRGEESLAAIRRYIAENPLRWAEDAENQDAPVFDGR